MNGKGVVKRITIFSSMIPLLFVLNSSSFVKKDKEYFRSKTKITKHIIEYNSGKIYIGSEYYLKSVKDELGPFDVLVEDDRNGKDPDLKIYDSYKIMSNDIKEEIVEALLYYEDVYPSKWDRTKNSLMREWTAHNLGYRFGYNHDSSADVDLNNGDEMTYRLSNYIKK